ncbi:MAG TPA: 6-bladed beta-propeller [Azospirillum sp.]|nr:6-bladed beta-propeller [Azospirillum sp.]
MALSLGACQTTEKKQAGVLAWPGPDDARFFWEQTIVSSSDVVAETQAQRLRRMATGETTSGHSLQKPWGVAAHDGRIYVTDTIARRVHVFDMRGKKYSMIGDSGVGSLAKPLDLSVDQSGKVYVCDNAGRRVVVFDADGKYLRSVGSAEILQKPSSVSVNKDGSRIYVVDTGGVSSDKHQVVIFDAAGNVVKKVGTRGSGPGEFNLPISVATNSANGNFYVVDGGNFRVESFTADGTYIKSFGDIGRNSGQFARPKAIAADRNGNLYITDSAFANFQIFDPDGRLLLDVGGRGGEGLGGQFMLPAGIAVDATDGRVYVVDQFFPKVDVFRPVETAEGRTPRAGDTKAAEAKK